MELPRRKWLKQVGLLVAGTGIARFGAIASPVFTANHFLVGKEDTVIRLSSNENPYGPSPAARAAMADAISSSNRYQWEMIRQLRTALGKIHAGGDDTVLVGAGSTQLIDVCLQLAALQKGNFVIAEPTFSRWTDVAIGLGLEKVAVPLTKDKRHDLAAMQKAIGPATRMVYLCNPNNPTGTICKFYDLLSFIKEASRNALVVVDEAYLDYTDESSMAGLTATNENVIIVKTFSKIFGLAGARVGYAVAHANTIKKMEGLQSGSNIGISAVSLAGALASLKDDGFTQQSYELNEQARSYTIGQLERLGIPCIPSHTNFIYFSLANYKKDFFEQLKAGNIEGTGIFEEKGKWSRITVGTMGEMKKFIAAIE